MIRTESGWCRPSPGQSAEEFAAEFAASRPPLTDSEIAFLRAIVRSVSEGDAQDSPAA